MYFDDHGPPHFHAYYGDDVAVIAIDTLEIIEGRLPRRALALAVEWAQQHRAELREDWRLAEVHQTLKLIPPLV
jgi:hypothetical protein